MTSVTSVAADPDAVVSNVAAIVDAATRSLLRQQQKEGRTKSRERRQREAQRLQVQQLPFHRRYRNIYSAPARSMSAHTLQRAFRVANPTASDRAALAYLAALASPIVAPR